MAIVIKNIIGRLDKLIELADSRSKGTYVRNSEIIEVKMGTNSILEALAEVDRQKYKDFLEKEQKKVGSSTNIINMYLGVLKWIRGDIDMGLYARLADEVGEGALVYEFTEGDLNRIQTLINELRDWISKSRCFEEEHRQRLLRKLEKLQAELHKKMSNYDRFWGLFVDVGIAFGKFGQAVKPMVERVQEIADIVFKAQSAAEKVKGLLPMRLLPNSEGNSDTVKSEADG